VIPAIVALPGPEHNDSKSSAARAATADALSSRTALQQRSEDGPELSTGLQAWNGGEPVSAGVVSSDPIAGTPAQSEMNVALRTEGLGAVQVRAHVTGDQVGAAITIERHDAHALLSSDLPSLHQALSDRQLRVESVSLFQSSPHAGAGVGDGAGRQQNPDGTPQRSSHCGETVAPPWGATENTPASDASETRSAFDSNGRLSVQA
jgi:flagellar hook-length control protein FliK